MTIFTTCPIKNFFRKSDNSNDNKTKKSDENIPNYERRMHLFNKIAYGMGGPPMQMLSNAIGFYLSIFLLETAVISPFYLSVIQIIARAWDAITDPVAGYLVNRTKSRFGKYKPWLLSATPLSCIAFFLQFYVPNTNNEVAKFAFYTFTIIFVQTGLTAFHVPYSSMCMVLTSNQQDRDQLTSIRMAFEIIGVMCGAGVFGGIALQHRVAGISANITITDEMRNLEKRDYMIAALAVCFIYIICSISVLLGTKEQDVFSTKVDPYLSNFKKIIKFKPYLYVMFAFMFTSLGIQIVQSNLALYITHSLNRPDHVNLGIIVLLVCAFLLVPLGHKMLRKFGKKKVFFAGNINMIPMLATLAFLPKDLNLIIFYGYMVWTSFSVMVALVLPWSMLPDVIDLFMIENGARMESTFYSFYVFFNKFAVGISLFLSSIALGLSGYDSTLRKQPDSVSNMLRYYIGSSGIICLVISMVFLYFYPIDEDKRKEIETSLIEMRRNFKSILPMIPTCESDLELQCDKIEPTFDQLLDIDLAAEVIVKNSQKENVDFLLGSVQSFRKI